MHTATFSMQNDTVRGLHPLNINIILYGNENWNSEANMVLLRAVHRYIHAAKRYQINFYDSDSKRS